MEIIMQGNFEIKVGNWPLAQDKPIVLFLHGASLSKSFWDNQVESLKDFVNTISIDLPGHGGTTVESRDSIKAFSKDMIRFLDSLSIRTPVIICGMSMGGAIAQQLLIDYSDYFEAGVLINTGSRLKVLPMIFDMVNSDYKGYVDNTAIFSISSKSDLEKIKKQCEGFTGKCSAETTINDFNACNGFDIMEKIPSIDKPILVIAATEDMSTPLKYGKWLADNITGAEFVQIEDAGHFSPLEKPKEINTAIETFMKRVL